MAKQSWTELTINGERVPGVASIEARDPGLPPLPEPEIRGVEFGPAVGRTVEATVDVDLSAVKMALADVLLATEMRTACGDQFGWIPMPVAYATVNGAKIPIEEIGPLREYAGGLRAQAETEPHPLPDGGIRYR
jgi:hypothetical protein